MFGTRLLANRLIVEDGAADAFAEAGRSNDQLPICPPHFLRLGNSQLGEAFIAGGRAFIHRQQTFVARNEGPRRVAQ